MTTEKICIPDDHLTQKINVFFIVTLAGIHDRSIMSMGHLNSPLESYSRRTRRRSWAIELLGHLT